MNCVDDLIAEHCPNGVEHRPLGEIGTFIRGNGLQKKDFAQTGLPCIHYGQIYTAYGTWTSTTRSFIAPELARTLRRAHPGDLIVTTTSENLDDVCKAVAWLGREEVAYGGHSCAFKHSLDPLYASYLFQTEAFRRQKLRYAKGTKVKEVSAHELARIVVPVPPIEIQREVATMLRRMEELKADLEAELEAELEARRRQYAHYRDSLISLDMSNVESVALSGLATFRYGYTAKATSVGEYRFLRITDITPQGRLAPGNAKYVAGSDDASTYVVEPGDLLVARTGATYGKTMLVGRDEPSVYASFLIRIRLDPARMRPAFYWHFAQSDAYWRQARALATSGGQPQFNGNVLKTVRVPAPPLPQQDRVVAILDGFDALTNELFVVLPAEIAARRKQYEHYRDRLLTFKELPAELASEPEAEFVA